MAHSINRNAKLLSAAFLLIFFGFDGVQQYVTTFFDGAGIKQVGFVSLIILYSVFTLVNPIGAVVISKIGAKRSMIGSVFFYTLYCLSLLTANPALIYPASALLGAFGAVLWTAQNSYLIRASDPAVYGANAGFFSTLFSVGAASGVLLLGLLLPILGYRGGFALFALVPLVALPFLGRVDDIRVEVKSNKWREMRRAMVSRTALRMSAIWFVFNFIQGLMLGIVPLEIKRTIGVWAIGLLVGSFYIMPMLFAYLFGKLSDLRGRRGMITLMYVLSIAGVGLMLGARVPAVLVAAILLLAFNFGISRTITFALVGDISNEQNVESVSALVWMVQSIAFTAALVVSVFFEGQAVYSVSLAVIVFSYLIFLPLRRVPLAVVRERIAGEIL
ncbi:MFS transporter [Candidatus Uhrbacteria bacterium]|nr:MFS transporter [Candidatus Uhrbacteria bacterium]